jgi:tetratricopeptide (TPR) repeat protein
MKRIFPIVSWLLLVLILAAADGCGSDPYVEGARLDLRNKDYNRALSNINKALENNPNNLDALMLKGDIIFEMLPDVYDQDERTAYIGELLGAYAQSVMLDSANALHKDRQLTILYVNEFTSAMAIYEDAEQLGGKERARGFVAAARRFRNASMVAPDSMDAFINEAYAYYGAGMARDAADTFEAAIANGHTNRELFIQLARTYELIATESADPQAQPGYYREAVRALSEAHERYPDDGEIRKLLLNAYAMADVSDAALSFFEEVHPLERDNKIFLYNYGTLLLRQQNYERAIDMLLEAVALDSSYTNALFNLGAAYVNSGFSVDERYQAVEDSLQNSSRFASQQITEMETRKSELGQLKQQLFGQAIKYFEAANDLVERDLGDTSEICDALYRAYMQTNQRSRAEEARICAERQGTQAMPERSEDRF